MTAIFSLAGRKALVTGGSRGIGAAVVELFARHGAEVALCHYRDEANAGALAARLDGEGFTVHAMHCDVADEADVAAMAAWAKERLGQVDILVNCAGIGGDKPFTGITVADWDRMIGVHLRGTFLVTHAFFGGMVERSYGRVINFASQLAYKGAPGLAHYCAAKAGIVGFTRALSYEGAPRRYGQRDRSRPSRDGAADGADRGMARHEEGAASDRPLRAGRGDRPTVLLLASPAGAFYAGQTLSPNGGDVMV